MFDLTQEWSTLETAHPDLCYALLKQMFLPSVSIDDGPRATAHTSSHVKAKLRKLNETLAPVRKQNAEVQTNEIDIVCATLPVQTLNETGYLDISD